MSSFLERLQSSQLHGPTSHKFDLKEWTSAAKPVAAEDANLFAIAVLIHHSLDLIRTNLVFVKDKAYSATRRRHELVAWANHQTLVAGRLAKQEADRLVPPANEAVLDRLADVRLKLPMGEFDVDSVVEAIVESCTRLLRMLAADTTAVPVDEPPVPYRQLVHDANLAIAYGTLESLWLDVLWNGFRFHPSKGFAPEDTLRLTQRAQSSHRHFMTTIQSEALQLARMQASGASPPPETHFPMLFARFDGRRCILTVESPDSSTLAARSVMLVSTLPRYYQAVADVQRKEFPALSLNAVARAYAVLVGMAQGVNGQAQAALDAVADREPIAELRNLAPTWERAALTQGLCSCLAIDALTAEQLVRFFTGAGLGASASLDPWAAPLVDLDGDRLTCFISALQHASLRRLADLWLSRLGFDLEFKGDAFEVEVRQSLQKTLAERSSLRPITQVLDRDFHLAPGYVDPVAAKAPGARKEEIDLVCGSRVVVNTQPGYL